MLLLDDLLPVFEMLKFLFQKVAVVVFVSSQMINLVLMSLSSSTLVALIVSIMIFLSAL